MQNPTTTVPELSPAEIRDLRCVAGMIIPASTEYDVPGADDDVIFADIVASIGRDLADVRRALATSAAAGRRGVRRSRCRGAARRSRRSSAPMGGTPAAALSRCVLQCYYRDDRVVISLGLEAAAAVPEGAHAGARGLVAAGSGAGAAEDVARCTVTARTNLSALRAGEVKTRSVAGEGDRGGTQLSYASVPARSPSPSPLRVSTSPARSAGEV